MTGVDYVCIPTQRPRDRARSSTANAGARGLERWQRPGEPAVGAEFQTGKVTLAVLDLTGLSQAHQTNPAPIALQVEDVAARAQARGAGVEYRRHDRRGVCHQANFPDPDGNALMLHHRYAPRSR